MASNRLDLAPHIEETVRTAAELQEEHDREATSFERNIARTTRFFGSPHFFACLTIGVALWVAINLAATPMRRVPFDKPPFQGLQGIIALGVLYMTILIFGTQQREQKMATRRARLTLQLAMINEQKSAKIIEQLEDLRRDSPFIRNRVDEKADAMSTPADAQAVLEALIESKQA
jgi:uncharacterized membrane protein